MLLTALAHAAAAADSSWASFAAKPGVGAGRRIVFITGDGEYKSEESMPMMAHILAERHGFDCTVLFAILKETGVIDMNQKDNIPGLKALRAAQLMVMFTRFRALPDEQMKFIDDYLQSGKPVIGCARRRTRSASRKTARRSMRAIISTTRAAASAGRCSGRRG